MFSFRSASATAWRSYRYVFALSLMIVSLRWAQPAQAQVPQIVPEISIHPNNLPAASISPVVLQIRKVGSNAGVLVLGSDFGILFDSTIANIVPDAQVSLQVGTSSSLLPSDFLVSRITGGIEINYINEIPKVFDQNESIFLKLMVTSFVTETNALTLT